MTIGHRFYSEYSDKEHRIITSVHSATVEDIVWCIINKREVVIWPWPKNERTVGKFVKVDFAGFHFTITETGETFISNSVGDCIEWVDT